MDKANIIVETETGSSTKSSLSTRKLDRRLKTLSQYLDVGSSGPQLVEKDEGDLRSAMDMRRLIHDDNDFEIGLFQNTLTLHNYLTTRNKA